MTATQGGPHRPNTNKPTPAPEPTTDGQATATPGPGGAPAAERPEPATDGSVAADRERAGVSPEPGTGASAAAGPALPAPAGAAASPEPVADASDAAGRGSDDVPPEPEPAEAPADAALPAPSTPASAAPAPAPAAPAGVDPPPPGATRARFVVRGIAGAAVLMAVVTVFARLAGFGRQLVFSGTVGDTVLGTAYSTVNSVPNIVFEIVAGGALASVVVPVLAGPVAKGARQDAGRIASALLTWVVLVLTPIVLLGALLARPIAELLLAGKADGPGVADVASRMLIVFVPQVLLYGIAVVAGGILQAHHRFLAGTLAPLVSSVVVAGSYLLFANRYDVDLDNLATLPRGAELTLSLGTTAGVLALALVTVVPLRSTGLRLRPTLHFPDGVARRVRTLALAGVATLIAQQAATIAVILLANGRGTHGSLVVYQTTWMVYLLPYAVLAVPIATAAFPRLSAHAHDGDRDAFADAVAATTRTVLLVGAAGTAMLLAAAAPLGRFFALFMAGSTEPEQMAWALAAFAPGLIGYALIAHLGRALNASGHGRAAAGCVVSGWVVVVVADAALAFALPARWTVAALGLGNSIGMTVAGLLLAYAVVRTAGPRALAGAALVKPAVCAPLAALAAGAAGFGTSRAFGTGDIVFTLIIAAVAAIVGTLVFAGVVSVTVGEAVKATLRGPRAAESEGEQRRGHDDGV
ncbi:murein biosynthesis integral membrane protein MurJ [Embleya sp. NPDC020886]|uniref:murein biosynthesis integral membrane protein MurJ n=1 Tax=Embleya sp. NPDC020886 TaxID=3363980 RepID=UPI0037A99551